jgi:uncharacterized protein YdhG (YjbR/CyaY superfamily)
MRISVATVEEYIIQFPENVQKLLSELRTLVKQEAPQAEERISYGMPAYKYKGVLVYFAGYDRHIGFYPAASGIRQFQSELSPYKFAKGSVQFPLTEPLPEDLIRRIVQFRLRENEAKATAKKAIAKKATSKNKA